MPSGNFFWCNIKLIIIKTLLLKNNVAWFTIYIYIYIYVFCHANIITVWCVYELWGIIMIL